MILSRISRLSVPDSRELEQLLSTQIATLGEDHEDVQQTRYLIATNFLRPKKLKELRLLALTLDYLHQQGSQPCLWSEMDQKGTSQSI